MLRRLLSVLLGLGVCTAVHAAELQPEERLQAIRQAMVDAAMNSHTLVNPPVAHPKPRRRCAM